MQTVRPLRREWLFAETVQVRIGTHSICWARSVGAYYAEGQLTINLVARTLAGKKVLACSTLPVNGEGLGAALGQWLESNLTPRQRRQTPVWIGLGAEQVFFLTRRIDTEQQELTPEAILSGTNATAIESSTVVTDGLPLKVGGSAAYSVAACQRQVAEGIRHGLQQAGIGNSRLAPAPSILLCVKGQCKAPKGWKVHIRLLLNENDGLAILVADGRPLLWRRFVMGSQEQPGIVFAIRHLQIHADQHLGIKELAGVLVLGPATETVLEALREDTGMAVVAQPGEPSSMAAYASAMATAARQRNVDSMDLFRSLRQATTLAQVFPRKLAVGMAVGIALMAVFLWQTVSGLDSDYQHLKRQNAAQSWAANRKTPEIEQERKLLTDETKAVQRFLATRVIWSDYLRDLPTRLPENSCLTGVIGTYELESLSNKQQKRASRSLTLRGMTRFSDRNMAPKEIDAFLDSLREVSLLKRDFPLVNLAEIKWKKEGNGDIAMFTVLAMPKEKQAAPREGGGSEGDHK